MLNENNANGCFSGAFVQLNSTEGYVLLGISFVSIEQAKINI
jgi:hypothetical protein